MDYSYSFGFPVISALLSFRLSCRSSFLSFQLSCRSGFSVAQTFLSFWLFAGCSGHC
jgi:hypothetical protein